MRNKLNTVEIGDNFEKQSLELIKKVIEEGQLGISDHLKIYTKKKYYSKTREDYIVFDLTIEVWPPNADRYVLIYFIECKSYTSNVPVNKVEDFHSKITQVGGVNVKGIFITNTPLQKGGFNLAKNLGIMVIEVGINNAYKIMLHKTNRSLAENNIPIIINTIDEKLLNNDVKPLEKFVDKTILNLLNESIDIDNIGIDKLSKERIEEFADIEVVKIKSFNNLSSHAISYKSLKNYIENEYTLEVRYLSADSELLGLCDLENNYIGINKTIVETNRSLFILAHEFGHFMLHQDLSIGQSRYNNYQDAEYNFKSGKFDLTNPKNWLEWQANYFASSLTLPKPKLLARLYMCQDLHSKSRGKILLDDDSHNTYVFYDIVRKLAYYFNVTQNSIIYRLKEMNLINNQSRLRSIGQIISEYENELFM